MLLNAFGDPLDPATLTRNFKKLAFQAGLDKVRRRRWSCSPWTASSGSTSCVKCRSSRDAPDQVAQSGRQDTL